MSEEKIEIGIIGGTGIYEPELLKEMVEAKVYTPYGETSDLIVTGIFKGKRVAFLPRHGKRHQIPPHMINYRANIWALKSLGVTRVIAVSAVGSLREEIAPGHFVIPDQFIDYTKSRKYTFYDGGQVAHISAADPFCPELRSVVINACKELGYNVHEKATYICIEGPRFSTRAESKMYRAWGADVIGMTLVPECILAREAEMCYVNIAMVTDYDVWADKPVSHEQVIKTLNENVGKVKKLLEVVIPRIPSERTCGCKDTLKGAIG